MNGMNFIRMAMGFIVTVVLGAVLTHKLSTNHWIHYSQEGISMMLVLMVAVFVATLCYRKEC